ncbi:MAG: winged helix-turn-helix transcriptional regulator [Mycobacteriales bacterium]
MRSYHQYCPVARTAAILGERWNPLILRELLDGATGFNEIQRGLPGINRTLLLSRLRELERLTLVEHQIGTAGQASHYQLTAAGHSLGRVIQAMGTWGAQWMFGEPEPDELDPHLLLWWIRRRINHDRLPQHRVVVLFDLNAVDRRLRYWLVLDRGEASICPQDPGFEVEVVVSADFDALYRVYAGQLSLADALRAGRVLLTGRRDLVKAFPAWMAWSPAAAAVRRYADATSR